MILSISALIIIILLCIFILVKVLREKSLANIKSRQTFSILLLWVILWSVSILITELFSKNLIVSLWASRFSFFTTALVGYWYYLFVRTYLKDEFNLFGKIFWGLVTLFFVVLSLSEKIVESVTYTEEGLQSVRGDFHLYFTIYTGIFLYIQLSSSIQLLGGNEVLLLSHKYSTSSGVLFSQYELICYKLNITDIRV